MGSNGCWGNAFDRRSSSILIYQYHGRSQSRRYRGYQRAAGHAAVTSSALRMTWMFDQFSRHSAQSTPCQTQVTRRRSWSWPHRKASALAGMIGGGSSTRKPPHCQERVLWSERCLTLKRGRRELADLRKDVRLLHCMHPTALLTRYLLQSHEAAIALVRQYPAVYGHSQRWLVSIRSRRCGRGSM